MQLVQKYNINKDNFEYYDSTLKKKTVEWY